MADDSFWGISYFIEAKLHRTGISAWEFKNSCEVLLNDEPYEAIPVPLFLGPRTFRVSCLVELLPRGTLTFGGKVNSNACGNETLRVNYAIHNESTSRVKVLVFDIAMRAGGRGCTYTYSIFHKDIKVANISGIEPMKRIGERKIDCIALLSQINEGEFGIDIPIGNIGSTYNGFLGSVTYELSMTIMTTIGSPDSTIRVPIIMHRCRANFAGHVPEVA